MNWLKIIGIGVREGIKIFTGFSPIAKAVLTDRGDRIIDKIEDSLNKAGQIVVDIEAIGVALSLSGEQKLTAASPLITQLILKSDLMLGKKIDNPTLFAEGVNDLTNAVVKILNSTKPE